MVLPGIGKHAERQRSGTSGVKANPVWIGVSGCEVHVSARVLNPEMIFRAAIAFGFGMEIPVFDVDAHGQSDIGIGRQLFVEAAHVLSLGRAVIALTIAALDCFRAHFNLDGVPVTRISHEAPDSRRSGIKRSKVLKIERRDKTVGIHPGANALGKNMSVHRQRGMKIRP